MSKKKKKKSKPKKLNLTVWICTAVLVVSTFLAFYPSLNNGFTNWDDEVYLHRNELIYNLSGKNIQEIFNINNPVSANYHPITVLSLAINYNFGKLSPYGYHLVNLLFHILNTLLVFLLVLKLTKQKWEWALITALVFGIHPMHVESVAWVSERKDVLYVFFLLAGLLTYLRYTKHLKPLGLLLPLVCFVLAVLSKAMAVVFPVLLLLIDYWINRKPDQRMLLEKVPFFLISLGFGYLAYTVQQAGGAVPEATNFTYLQKICFASYGFVMYIAKLFVPIQLSAFYPYPSVSESGYMPVFYYIAPVIALLLVGMIGWFYKRNKVIAFGMAFYLITIALVLQFISVGAVVMAERYSYLPYVGLGFILGGGFSYLYRSETINKQLKMGIAGIAGGYFILMGMFTFQQSKVWYNSETLWNRVIDLHGYKVGKAYKNRGNYLAKNGRVAEGMKDFEVAIQLSPNDPDIIESLANSYASQGQLEKSLPYFNRALEYSKSNPSVYYNRGIVHAQLKQFEKAMQDFNIAESKGQSLISILPSRAHLWLELQQYDKSIADYNLLIQKKPKEGRFYLSRGKVHYTKKDYAAAMKDFDMGQKLLPNIGESYYLKGLTFLQMGDKAQAKQHIAKAQQLKHQIPKQILDALN